MRLASSDEMPGQIEAEPSYSSRQDICYPIETKNSDTLRPWVCCDPVEADDN